MFEYSFFFFTNIKTENYICSHPGRNITANEKSWHRSNAVLVTWGSTAQYCTIFSSLWVCPSCHRSGCRRQSDPSASCTPPAGPAHLEARNTAQLFILWAALTSAAYFNEAAINVRRKISRWLNLNLSSRPSMAVPMQWVTAVRDAVYEALLWGSLN